MSARVCASPACGKPLTQRPNEPDHRYRNRQTCGLECGRTIGGRSESRPKPVPAQDVSWQDRAACRDIDDAELFFPVGTDPERCEDGAKAICATCPVTSQCLSFALAMKATGIWGGTNDEERKRIQYRVWKRASKERARAAG